MADDASPGLKAERDVDLAVVEQLALSLVVLRKVRPPRHSSGCSRSSHCHSGAVTAAKLVIAAGCCSTPRSATSP